jgi:hypothetical protein
MGSTPVNENGLLQQIVHVAQMRSKVVRDFMNRRNVVACGVGYKIAGNQEIPTPCVAVSVTHKEPASMLSADDLIPQMVEDVPTDVVETGEIVALGINRRTVLRPVRPGLSIGHIQGTTGTIGCIVKRGTQRYILSNNHVMALVNKARLGDPIIQPGRTDGGSLDDTIAELAAFVPLRFVEVEAAQGIEPMSQSPEPRGFAAWIGSLLALLGWIKRPSPVPATQEQENLVDAALALPVGDLELDPNIIDIGGPPLGITEPRLGMNVIKSGRTTGITEGRIMQVNATVNVKYGDNTARFTNQIMLSSFSERGDSGSLLMDYQRNAVGLLFSGSGVITVASPIEYILSALDVDLVTE